MKPARQALRILFVSHAYVVGVNQGKLNAIAQTDDLQVGLIAPTNWKALEWNKHLPLERPYSNLSIFSAPVLFTGRVGAHFYPPWFLKKVIKDFQPDLIQVEAEVFSICAFEVALLAKMMRIPVVVFGWENQQRNLPFFRRQTCKFVLNTASAIVCGNQDGADIMRQWGYRGLIEVMPQMGVDPKFFAPVSPNALPDASFRIGFLGRLAYSKGIDLIFKAVTQLRSDGFAIQIILCGSGPEEPELRKLSEELKISELINWRGAVPHSQAPAELSQFDVLVLPSRSTPGWKEQFGHVLIEAMSMGIPVIGSSSGEIPNVIGRLDLVFPEEDYLSLANLLKRLIDEADWRKDAGHYGIARVAHLYSHEQIASRLSSLWRTVIANDIM